MKPGQDMIWIEHRSTVQDALHLAEQAKAIAEECMTRQLWQNSFRHEREKAELFIELFRMFLSEHPIPGYYKYATWIARPARLFALLKWQQDKQKQAIEAGSWEGESSMHGDLSHDWACLLIWQAFPDANRILPIHYPFPENSWRFVVSIEGQKNLYEVRDTIVLLHETVETRKLRTN